MSRPWMMPLRRSIRPSGSRKRRSSAFARKDLAHLSTRTTPQSEKYVDGSAFDLLYLADGGAGDGAGGRRGDGGFHLHRLDGGQRLAGVHGIALGHLQGDDPGEGRGDLIRVAA